MSSSAISHREVAPSHVEGIVEICRAEGWESFYDPNRVWRVLNAPGVCAVVALEDERVVGFAYVQSDGEIQAHLSNIAVTPSHRRRGCTPNDRRSIRPMRREAHRPRFE